MKARPLSDFQDFQDFTKDEYDWLYNLAPNIQNTSVNRYASLWQVVKNQRPTGRSAEDWQKYHERVVLPVWKKEAASKQDASDDPGGWLADYHTQLDRLEQYYRKHRILELKKTEAAILNDPTIPSPADCGRATAKARDTCRREIESFAQDTKDRKAM